MENTCKKYDDMEISISIKDLLMQIALKWRAMLVWALLLAALCNVLSVTKSYQAQKISNEKATMTKKELLESSIASGQAKVEEAKGLLSQREIEEVDRAVETYDDLTQKYYDLLSYSEHSIKMQLDPNHVQTGYLQYTVDNHYSVEYPVIAKRDNTESILGAIGTNACTDDVCREISSKLGDELDPAWIKELIVTNIQSGNIVISVQGISKESCEVMLDVIKEALNNVKDEMRKAYGDFDLIIVSEKYGECPNEYILNDQINCINNINILKNTMNNLTNIMTEQQRQYYVACLDVKSLENNDLDEIEIQESRTQKTETKVLQYFDITFILVGLFLGIIIVCFWQGIAYLLSEKLRMANDLEDGFGVRIIGEICDENVKKLNALDRKIKEVFYGRKPISIEENMAVLCTSIRTSAQKMGMKSIYLTTSSSNANVMSVLEKICGELKNGVEEVAYGPSIVYNSDSIEKMAQSEGIVLVERIGDSKYMDIKKEIEKCCANKVTVLGSIVIE